MFQSSKSSTEKKEVVRELTQERFVKIVDAFKSNGYVYGDSKLSSFGSWVGADGTDVALYIDSLEGNKINKSFGDEEMTLLDAVISVMCSEEAAAERAASQVSDLKFKECAEILVKKGALITEDSFVLAKNRGADLFEIWCSAYMPMGTVVSATSIIDAFIDNDQVKYGHQTDNILKTLLYIYYRYKQVDKNEFIPAVNNFEIDVLSIHEKATKEINRESYAVEATKLREKQEELERLTNETEAKLEEYRQAHARSETAKHQHQELSVESVKFSMRKLQEMCTKYAIDSLRLAEEIDLLIKQRAKNSEEKSKLESELELFNFPILEESSLVQGIGQVKQLNSAINLTKQEKISALSIANQSIAKQILEKKASIALYRKAYDQKIAEINHLQEELPICREIGARIEEWSPMARGGYHAVKEWFGSFLTTTHLQYQGVDCSALCITSLEKHVSTYFECLYSAVPVIGYRNQDDGNNILHRFFECLNERSKIHDKLAREGVTVLNRHIIFSLLFLPDLAVEQNKEGKTPIQVASGYLKGKTNFNAIAEEFVQRG